MTSPTVDVNPQVLRWARESSGYTYDDVSKKTNIATSTIMEWETAPSKIRFSVLEKLAGVFKRPTAALLFDKPPVEPATPTYFRRKDLTADLKPELRFAIRKARYFQNIAKDLAANIHLITRPEIGRITLGDSPEKIADLERLRLGVTIESQIEWETPLIAFREFRTVLEKKNIYVFQMSIPVEEAQGFSLTDDIAPVIVVNSKDIFQRRIFTLFHEYAHILIGRAGVCADIDEYDEATDEIERWCNRFAGSFLVPKKRLSKELATIAPRKMTYEQIGFIANKFKVSKHMIFVRLNTNDLISKSEATELSKFFGKEKVPRQVVKKAGGARQKGGAPQYRRCISERGPKFVNLILENNRRNQITTSEALNYLSIKLRNLEKLEMAVCR